MGFNAVQRDLMGYIIHGVFMGFNAVSRDLMWYEWGLNEI